ncbi:MAG: aminotransferase class I/II-fold pyridoxal phosphate-dependent enzyme [SAR324 cluster bacterium]|nr:aminotransferase class I/II-fold pyridoxal phosphate-dependent enzyme [SAR324 cluster bacterium]
MSSSNKKLNFSTLSIHTAKPSSDANENSTPIFLNSGYKFKDSQQASALFKEEIPGLIYSRYGNPNVIEFEQKMCALEGMEAAFATSTGMGAITLAFSSFLKSGDHIVACRSLFGSSHQLITKILPRWGISYTYVDIEDIANWEKAITPNTKILFLETPSNPGLDLVDLEFVAGLTKEHKLLFMVDNCFASPYVQNPAKFGADVVVHSATKIIDGQGRAMGGVVLCSQQLFDDNIKFMARHTGPIISPFNAWLLSKSLETLAVRLDRQCDSSLEIANRLEKNNQVKMVKYPFLNSHPQYQVARKQMKKGGNLVTCELIGGIKRAIAFVDSLKMVTITANLGDSKTLITHPFLTTHAKLLPAERARVNITDELLRLSIGLEDVDDIWQDINQAIESTRV